MPEIGAAKSLRPETQGKLLFHYFETLGDKKSMTFITAYLEEGIPVLLGDILLTNYTENVDHVNGLEIIPTIGETKNVYEPEWGVSISGLRRKLCIVNDKVALAWTGDSIAAQVIISEIKNLFASNFDNEKLFDYLRYDVDYLASLSCIIIGWVVTDGSPLAFKWDSSTPKDIITGTFFAEGSGARYAQEFRLANKLTSPDTSLDKIVNLVLGRCSHLLGDESFFRIGLNYRFGGYFDSIIYNGEKFINLGDVATVIWAFVIKEGRVVAVHWTGQIIEGMFIEDLLCIRSYFLTDLTHVGEGYGVANHIFTVPPAHRDITKEESLYQRFDVFSSKTIASYAICHFVDLEINPLFVTLVSDVEDESRAPLLIVRGDNGLVTLDAKQEFFDMIYRFLLLSLMKIGTRDENKEIIDYISKYFVQGLENGIDLSDDKCPDAVGVHVSLKNKF